MQATQQQPAAQRQRPAWNWKGLVIQIIVIYAIYSLVFKKSTPVETDASGKPLPAHRPLFKGGDSFDFYVYISENSPFPPSEFHTSTPIWTEKGITYDWNPANHRSAQFNISLSEV